jgi:hypothetical protein
MARPAMSRTAQKRLAGNTYLFRGHLYQTHRTQKGRENFPTFFWWLLEGGGSLPPPYGTSFESALKLVVSSHKLSHFLRF